MPRHLSTHKFGTTMVMVTLTEGASEVLDGVYRLEGIGRERQRDEEYYHSCADIVPTGERSPVTEETQTCCLSKLGSDTYRS